MTRPQKRDANDILREDGADALRAKLDRAQKFNGEKTTKQKSGTLHFTLYRDIERSLRKVWLVGNFLGVNELSCIFGAPGCGKSVLASDLAAHVAAGRPWFNRRIMQGGVLYIAAERAALVKRRLAAFRLHYGLDDIPLAVVSGAVDLRSSRADAGQIIELAHKLENNTKQKLTLLVIDTVSRVLAGGDENSPKDLGGLIGNLSRIQEATEAHICLLHHVPHEAQRMRGHGSLLAACDTTIHVENSSAVRTARIDKTNDGAEGECLAFTLASIELHHDPDTDQVTTAPIVEPANDATPQHRLRRVTGAKKVAFDILRRAIDDAGAIPPASNHTPPNTRTIPVETWRSYAYQANITESDKPDARQKAFVRAVKQLQEANLIGIWGENVWLIT